MSQTITSPGPVTTQSTIPSYVQRDIRITITLGKGAFGSSGMNKVTLPPLRTLVTVQKAGMPSFDKAEIRVFGVTQSIMNAVSTLGIPLPMVRANNTVLVEAGDTVNGMATVYSGYIQNAWQNLDGSPETFLHIIAYGGSLEAVAPSAPSSFPATADVATIMSGLATQMGWNFENNGVQVQLSSPYFSGTAMQQAENLARAANIEMYLDSGSHTIAIWPKSGTRGGLIPLISANGGLVGYPRFRDQGMGFTCLFNPNIRIGGQILMRSIVSTPSQAPASGAPEAEAQMGGPNGYWMVIAPLTYDLAAQVPNGPWFCDVNCARTIVPGRP